MAQRHITKILLLVASAFVLSLPVSAEVPLLQPGKKTLYQRVLTRPGARLAKTVDTIGKRDNKLIQAFSRFYVYERRNHGGAPWLRIGADTKGKEILGWMAEERTVAWKQQLTLALTNPGAVRDRLLFFNSWSQLKKVLDSPRPASITRPLINKLERGGNDPRIAAIEPETFIDINKRFYLLPILEHDQILARTGEPIRALKIASVTQPTETSVAKVRWTASAPTTTAQYRAALVFVIDSTISMGPYIDETKAAVEQIYDRLDQAEVIDRVGFGLVAFRASSTNANRSRKLGYVDKVFVDPSEVRDAETFLRRVKGLRNASVSTDYFDEDAFAGIIAALDEVSWEGFDARFIVLITDAGALDGTTVESITGLDAGRVASIAGEKQVAITVLHLKTPAGGAENHRRAERQYRELARNARFQVKAYLPIEAGSVHNFRHAVDTLAKTIIANVGQEDDTAPVQHDSPGSTSDPSIEEIARALGHAMRLRYLGKLADTRVPTLFEAWISDRDFADSSKATVEVRVLLTKNQLSDLHMILQKIIHASRSGMLKPTKFFDSLRSLAAQFGRDPNRARDRRATRLADLGLLDEYLEDLPYQSQVMNLSQETWTAWGPQKQLEFLNQLRRKLRQYARYNEEWDSWVNLAQTVDAEGEWVYPVPLADMP